MNSFHHRLTCLALFAALGCDRQHNQTTTVESTTIVATSWPVAFLSERLAGDDFEVQCPIPAGADPITWEPDRAALVSLTTARLVVLNGAGFEPWADRTSLPLSRVVITADRFKRDWIVQQDLTHSHGPRGDHSHGGTDPHTWLDPMLALAQAGAIRDALIERNPHLSSAVEARFAELSSELQEIHEGWMRVGQALAGRRLIAAHAAYDYLAGRHGWKIHNLDLDPAGPLSEQDLSELRDAATSAPALALLWESEPKPAVAAAAKQASGLPNVVLSPAEVRSAEQRAAGVTFLDVQRSNVERLLSLCQATDE